MQAVQRIEREKRVGGGNRVEQNSDLLIRLYNK